MHTKSVEFHDHIHASILEEMNILADAVRLTLGPKGRYQTLKRRLGIAPIAKRGVAIAKEIELQNKLQNIGAQMLKQVALMTAEIAGDGSTTATVLAQAIVQEGTKYLISGANPLDLKCGIDKAVAATMDELKKISLPCSTKKELAQVAAISANADSAIGGIIAQALEKVGREGAILVEDGNSLENALDVVKGMQFESAYIHPNCVNNPNLRKLILNDPLILLCDKPILTMRDLRPLLKEVVKAGKPLLIMAEDVDDETLATCIADSKRRELQVAAIKLTSFGKVRNATLEDIAVLTGTNIISEEIEPQLRYVSAANLGRAKRVVIDQEKTTIIDSAGEPKAITAHVDLIRHQVENTTSANEREALKGRLATLVDGVAVIKVGAASAIEMIEKKGLVEDALLATRAAVEEGIVPGGGVALLRARAAIKGVKGDNSDQDAGIKIVMRALEEPLRAIAFNAGDVPAVVVAKVYSGLDHFGYNAATGEYGDLVQLGVVDPTKVTRTALQNAASIAGLILTKNATDIDVGRDSQKRTP